MRNEDCGGNVEGVVKKHIIFQNIDFGGYEKYTIS